MPYDGPNDCPECGGGSKAKYLRAHGMCSRCVKARDTGKDAPVKPKSTLLAGVARRKALASIAAWLEQHPHPWDRANDGLFMGVPVSDRAGWP